MPEKFIEHEVKRAEQLKHLLKMRFGTIFEDLRTIPSFYCWAYGNQSQHLIL